MKLRILLLLISALIVSPALAQEDNDLINSELEKTLDEEKEAFNQEKSEAEKQAEADQVTKNLDAALNNYERIIQNQPSSKAGNISSRINENEKLINQRSKRLETEQEKLKRAKISLLTRYMNLKKAHAEGTIPTRIFREKEQKILAQYNFNITALESDIKVYKEDIDSAQSRLQNLREEEKMHKIEYPNVYKPKKKKLNPLDSLLAEIKKHSRFQVQNAFSYVSSKDLLSPGYSSNQRHMTSLYNQAMIAHEMEDFSKSQAYFYQYLDLVDSLGATPSEEDNFQACYLAYLTRDWKSVKYYAAKLSDGSKQELSATFSDHTLR